MYGKSSAAADKRPGHINKLEELNMVALSEQTVAVYVLDDDSSFLKSTRRLLDSAGYKVQAFTDPIAFLEDAAMHRPEVAVIDIRMPEMNGLEVQRRLRTVSPSTRVIILTSKNDPLVRMSAMNGGASAFFIKGMENEELLAGIKVAADSRN
jgi:FixJ family two-component response regulator